MIWIDITEIKNWEGHHTGIQRVISELSSRLVIINQDKYKLCYFDRSLNRYFEYVNHDGSGVILSSRVNPQSFGLVKYTSKTTRVASGIIKSIRKKRNIDESIFQQKDILFIPGAFWVYSFDLLADIKNRYELSIFGVMYDLVPLVVPQFTAKVTVESFGDNFSKALELFDGWFSISENTKKDLIDVAKKRSIKVNEESIKVIKLGTDVYANGGQSKPSHPTIRPEAFCLFVSTIEARKNQTIVYNAVKLLQQKNIQHLPIVLAGKHGWLSDDLIYIIENDQTIKQNIIWLDSVDDKTLVWLYKNCSFTIYPSFYEGWGLPIAESLNYGKPCLVSNTSSMPEVAGGHVEYFSPYDSNELSVLIAEYSDSKILAERKQIIAGYEPYTWDDCAIQVDNLF